MTSKSLPIIGVVGAGTMGSGIALVALYAGCEVYLQDAFPQALEKASAYIKGFLEKKDQSDRYKKLHLVNSLDDISPAGVVIEAALEQMDLKTEIFRKLDAVCPPPAVLTTNTSTLSVTAIAASTQHPERVAGMHFFNPAPVLPLVEVVRGARTSQETIDRLTELAQAFDKTPVVTGDTPGFIVNRVARPFYGEALRILGEGNSSHEMIDQIVESGGGFKMGPFKLMDLIGIDINTAAMRSMYEQTYGEPRYRPHWLQVQKLAEGALGKKVGKGFYDYENGEIKDTRKWISEVALQVGGGSGRILVSEGSWAPGLSELCTEAGYVVDSIPVRDENPVACFVVAGRHEDAARLISWYDQNLDSSIPIIAQCADITISEMKDWVNHPQRLIGFDGLFFGTGSIVTLVNPTIPAEKFLEIEDMFMKLGRQPIYINDGPALVLPRIICQIINEAIFLRQDELGLLANRINTYEVSKYSDFASATDEIDIAMRLGTNYPKGPMEWAVSIGYRKVLGVLDHLYNEFREDRYRASSLLREWARQEARSNRK
ncbi:MAG TPA: 3-hydroxyacyl-CoA dehydrogenase NAD-binding domain-containing protein [Anaerolineales bacterium]|nr:3-hydroxyacyl-CoA dehydrogenase NAD-binding domain-containing protein [Anaerolineales bacterium]